MYSQERLGIIPLFQHIIDTFLCETPSEGIGSGLESRSCLRDERVDDVDGMIGAVGRLP